MPPTLKIIKPCTGKCAESDKQAEFSAGWECEYRGVVRDDGQIEVYWNGRWWLIPAFATNVD